MRPVLLLLVLSGVAAATLCAALVKKLDKSGTKPTCTKMKGHKSLQLVTYELSDANSRPEKLHPAVLISGDRVVWTGDPVTHTTRDQDTAACGAGPTVKGIDVSVYQGTIDWTRVKADGVQYAIIRVSDGLNPPDSKFAANWSDSRAAG